MDWMDEPQQLKLLGKLKQAVPQDRRWFLIAIDGYGDAGKSTIARFLAWQLQIAVLETDLFLSSEAEQGDGRLSLPGRYRLDDLVRIFEAQRTCEYKLIVEGIGLLKVLKAIE